MVECGVEWRRLRAEFDALMDALSYRVLISTQQTMAKAKLSRRRLRCDSNCYCGALLNDDGRADLWEVICMVTIVYRSRMGQQ